MALVVKDRIKETSSTTGTGTLTLGGAVDGFRTFADVGNGNTTYYCIEDGNNFEVGIGTYTASGTTLSRDTVLQTSAGNTTKINCSGSQKVFVTQPADKAVFEDASGDTKITNNLLVGTDVGSYNTSNFEVFVSNADQGTTVCLYDDSGAYNSALIKYDTNILSLGLNNANSANTILTTSAINVTSTGVGIGLDSPQRPLVLYKNDSGQTQIQFQNQTTGTANSDGFGVGLDTQEDGFLWNYEGGDVYLGGATASRIMTLKGSSGNVGIGENNPDTTLHVTGTAKIEGNKSYYADTLAATNSTSLALNISPTRASVTKSIAMGAIGSSNTHTGLQAYDSSDNSANNFSINPLGGNVGIATSTPASLLTVNGDGTTVRLDGSANTTRTIFFRSTTTSNPAQIYADGSLRLRTEDASTAIIFNTNSSGTNNEAMRIESTQNTVFRGDIIADKYLRLRTTDDQANQWYVYTHTDDTFRINYNGNGADELVIDEQGRVAVGGTTPNVARGGYTDLVIGQGQETGQGSTQPQIELYHSSASWAINNDSTLSNQMGFHYNNGSSWSQILALKPSGSSSTFSGDIQAAGIYVGSTNTSYDFYNNGTSYLNGATTVDDRLTAKAISLNDNGISGAILEVRADDGGPWGFRIGNDTVGTSAGYSFYQNDNGSCNHYTYGNGSFVTTSFNTNDGTNNIGYMTVDTNGSVNITPGTGQGSNDASLYVNGPNGNDWGCIINKASGDYGLDLRGTSGSYALRITDGSERFRITWGGTILVNGSSGSSGQVLTSNGGSSAASWQTPSSGGYSADFSGYANKFSVGTSSLPSTGEIRATGNITAYYSDERLKDFHGKIENAVDKVKSLNGYYYSENEKAKEYGYEKQDKKQVGVSAQEVEKVLPEIVSLAPFDIAEDGTSKSGEDYKTVDYEKLVPLLIEAIKEQQTQIDYLKEKLNGITE